MLDIIKDIKTALGNDAYIAATALALTMPDICCQVEKGISSSNRNNYITWANNHMDKEDFTFPLSGFERQRFDGEMCYALRCKVLHNGNVDIKDSQMTINVDQFVLTKPGDNKYFKGYTYSEETQPDGSTKTVTYIGADYLCERLCEAVELFYNSWPNKADFDSHSIWVK